ncbi:YHS domain-containing protein [archaeon RBG_16_50_20]|nr:MAG: YHS domain-containing protein [archaeon RBG_16_50_20]
MARDPVCGMKVTEKKATGSSVYLSATYFFCSPNCKTEFDRNPSRYVK